MNNPVEIRVERASVSVEFDGHAYATEPLVTDTRAYDVVKYTAATITIRPRGEGEIVDSYNDGSGYPVNTYSTVAIPEAATRVLRRRKDGTYRAYDGGRALIFRDAEPTTRTDYRF